MMRRPTGLLYAVRGLAHCGSLGVVMLLMPGCLTSTAPASRKDGDGDRVWIGPMPFVSGRRVRADWIPVITDASAWPEVLRQSQVFKTYIMILPRQPVPGKDEPEVPDEQVHDLVRFVRRHGLKVAFEVGGIRMHEGVPLEEAGERTAAAELVHLQRWLDAGGRIDFLTTDHAVMMNLGAPYVTPDTRRHWGFTMDDLIREQVDYFEAVHRVLPRARLGAIESLGYFHVKTGGDAEYARTVPALPVWQFDEYIDALVQAMAMRGLVLDHFHIDYGFMGVRHDGGGRDRLDAGRVVAVERMVQDRGVRAGVIVNAFHDRRAPEPVSAEEAGREAHERTLRFLQAYRVAGGHADHLVIQTWQPYPDRTGPENTPGTVLNIARDVLRSVTATNAGNTR